MFWYYSRMRRIEKGKEKRENEKKERECAGLSGPSTSSQPPTNVSSKWMFHFE
jgi:hypothetical protein